MVIESFDAVFYTAMFILPGFIIKNIIDMLNPPRKTTDPSFLLGCLAYSLVNAAIFSWAFILVGSSELRGAAYWGVLLGIVLVGAVLIAFVVALLKQRRWIYEIVKKLRMKVIDPTPTAWDFWFSKQECSFVFITLKDGSTVEGWFGVNSFASSDPDQRDIFIERTYSAGELSPKNAGLYIPKDEIKSIEFKREEESDVK